MPRFFVLPEAIQGSMISLGENNAAHMKALRLRPGEEIIVSTGGKEEYRCVYRSTDLAEIRSIAECETEPTVRVTLFAAFPKGDKPEFITQKAVELGAGEICFFLSSRCISRPDEKALKKRLERLSRVSEEAAMQAGRGRIPMVSWFGSFQEMAENAAAYDRALFLWEEAREISLRRTLLDDQSASSSFAIVTGPEGGFSREEADMAVSAGLIPITLGKRILRCETAPLCALSAVMYETGNLE